MQTPFTSTRQMIRNFEMHIYAMDVHIDTTDAELKRLRADIESLKKQNDVLAKTLVELSSSPVRYDVEQRLRKAGFDIIPF